MNWRYKLLFGVIFFLIITISIIIIIDFLKIDFLKKEMSWKKKLSIFAVIFYSLVMLYVYITISIINEEIYNNLYTTYGKVVYINNSKDYKAGVCYKFKVNNKIYIQSGGNSELKAKMGNIYRVHCSLKDPTKSWIFIDSIINQKYDTINFNKSTLQIINNCGRVKFNDK